MTFLYGTGSGVPELHDLAQRVPMRLIVNDWLNDERLHMLVASIFAYSA
jgi:hypothetical protein